MMKDRDFLNECYITEQSMGSILSMYPHHRQSFTSHIQGLKNIDDIEEHNKKFRNKRKRP